MALARLISRGQAGLDAYEVSVEVHIAGGLPAFTITGLPTAAVRESRDRVRAALQTSGAPLPAKRITVHLGPADVPKDGGRFDLPIALGIVKAELQPAWSLDATEFIGELSLAGELRPVSGVVSAALAARADGRRLVVPRANAAEVALVPGARAFAAAHLSEVLDDLNGVQPLGAVENRIAPAAEPADGPTLDEVIGHAPAKRALCIAAAGGHNLLMIGPPGSGKSMLAERLPTLLPPLSERERLSVASIASAAGRREWTDAACRRPYRAPHHTTPVAALIGGGARPLPGEVSLAHLGVLFLDELPEFSRAALEALREPLESGAVAIARVKRQTRYPARFQLVAAMNPCACGYLGDGTDRCRCSPARRARYAGRVSGPLLDRFDMHIEVPHVAFADLAAETDGPRSAELRAAVTAARRLQLDRRGCINAALGTQQLMDEVRADAASRKLLADAQARWRLSARSVVRVLRVARTIADLDECEATSDRHVAEALQLRCLDRPTLIDTV